MRWGSDGCPMVMGMAMDGGGHDAGEVAESWMIPEHRIHPGWAEIAQDGRNSVRMGGVPAERMNSPLEGREVRLRGLSRDGAVREGGPRARVGRFLGRSMV